MKIKLSITNKTADKGRKEGWSFEFTKRFREKARHTFLEFGPFNLTDKEKEELMNLLDFVVGPDIASYGVKAE